MKICGTFAQQKRSNAKEFVRKDGFRDNPLGSANTYELQQFMIMPRLGKNLE